MHIGRWACRSSRRRQHRSSNAHLPHMPKREKGRGDENGMLPIHLPNINGMEDFGMATSHKCNAAKAWNLQSTSSAVIALMTTPSKRAHGFICKEREQTFEFLNVYTELWRGEKGTMCWLEGKKILPVGWSVACIYESGQTTLYVVI